MLTNKPISNREATLVCLRAYPHQNAAVGQAHQDALGISRRDRETVAEAILRAEREPVWVAVEALLKSKWLPLLQPHMNAEQQEELQGDLHRVIVGEGARRSLARVGFFPPLDGDDDLGSDDTRALVSP